MTLNAGRTVVRRFYYTMKELSWEGINDRSHSMHQRMRGGW